MINVSKVLETRLCYRPHTKLGEGNVFTGICLFIGRGWGGIHVTTTHDALGLTGTYPLLVTSGSHHWGHKYIPPASDTWWPSLETQALTPLSTSDMRHG